MADVRSATKVDERPTAVGRRGGRGHFVAQDAQLELVVLEHLHEVLLPYFESFELLTLLDDRLHHVLHHRKVKVGHLKSQINKTSIFIINLILVLNGSYVIVYFAVSIRKKIPKTNILYGRY